MCSFVHLLRSRYEEDDLLKTPDLHLVTPGEGAAAAAFSIKKLRVIAPLQTDAQAETGPSGRIFVIQRKPRTLNRG